MERVSATYQLQDEELHELLIYLEERGFVVNENLVNKEQYNIYRRINTSSSRVGVILGAGRIEGNRLEIHCGHEENPLFEVAEAFLKSHPSRRDDPSFTII